MSNLEANINEVVNTGLGALGEIETAIASNKAKAEGYIKSTGTKVDETRDAIVKYMEELKLKGATDESELALNIKTTVKDLMESVDVFNREVDEFTSANFAKLKLELAKYEITLPEVAELEVRLDALVTDGKSKIDALKASLLKEKVEA